MTPEQRATALRLADWLRDSGVVNAEVRETEALLRGLAAEPIEPAPGYCKHCKQYTIEEPLPAEPAGTEDRMTTTQDGEGQVERPVRRWLVWGAVTLRLVAAVAAGMLMWVMGLAALDVPAGLPLWRHIAGATLIILAASLLRWPFGRA
jgi:hypothetical protein